MLRLRNNRQNRMGGWKKMEEDRGSGTFENSND